MSSNALLLLMNKKNSPVHTFIARKGDVDYFIYTMFYKRKFKHRPIVKVE